jgi:RNA polymerase sigma-70 factor (ECF subfamily)
VRAGTGAMSALVERLRPIGAAGESGKRAGNSRADSRESELLAGDSGTSLFGARTAEPDADFATRMRETKQVVFRVACSVLREAADAEEIAQDAFLQAYGQMGSLREPAKFRAWVCRITFRLALNRRRAQGRRMARDTAWHESRAKQVHDGERAGAEREYLARLRAEIERLPEKLRSAVLLVSVAGMEASEVAAVLEIPPGTVRRRLHDARKKLVKVMSDEVMAR